MSTTPVYKKPLLIAVACVALLATTVLIVWMGFLSQSGGSCLFNSQNITVEMNTTGFSPNMIEIPVCTKITFLNNDERLRWPASDYHPTHGIYPEFDPQHSIEPDNSWSFVFDKPGQWKFHDHLTPSMRGTITVRSH